MGGGTRDLFCFLLFRLACKALFLEDGGGFFLLEKLVVAFADGLESSSCTLVASSINAKVSPRLKRPTLSTNARTSAVASPNNCDKYSKRSFQNVENGRSSENIDCLSVAYTILMENA